MYNLDSTTDTPFDCLSYVWGARDPPSLITLIEQDEAGEKKKKAAELSITPNCAAALRGLRRRFKSRRIWVDAICIDQTSVSERSSQVSFMAEIYNKAECVLIWLQVEREYEIPPEVVCRKMRYMDRLYRAGLLRLKEVNEETMVVDQSETRIVRACQKYAVQKLHDLGGM